MTHFRWEINFRSPIKENSKSNNAWNRIFFPFATPFFNTFDANWNHFNIKLKASSCNFFFERGWVDILLITKKIDIYSYKSQIQSTSSIFSHHLRMVVINLERKKKSSTFHFAYFLFFKYTRLMNKAWRWRM